MSVILNQSLVNVLIFLLSIFRIYSQNIDSSLVGADTLLINKSSFVIQLKNDNNKNIFYILRTKDTIKDTIIKEIDYYPADREFIDFNNDGFTDILIIFLSNVPRTCDLFMFDINTNTFRKVENFQKFPDPKRVLNTKYFYSYHRSGCADMNWDSDLFYIENYTVIKIANIQGTECENSKAKGIFVYKVNKEDKKLYKTISIEEIYQNKEVKWGFIESYWAKNYKIFIR